MTGSVAIKMALAGLVSVVVTVAGSGAVSARTAAGTDDGSVTVQVAALPVSGQQTYAAILRGGPFRYDKDGTVFGNRERLLPLEKRGYYREYTVVTEGSRDRGARRIVCGGPAKTPKACYYTGDHYASFRKIVSKPN